MTQHPDLRADWPTRITRIRQQMDTHQFTESERQEVDFFLDANEIGLAEETAADIIGERNLGFYPDSDGRVKFP